MSAPFKPAKGEMVHVEFDAEVRTGPHRLGTAYEVLVPWDESLLWVPSAVLSAIAAKPHLVGPAAAMVADAEESLARAVADRDRLMAAADCADVSVDDAVRVIRKQAAGPSMGSAPRAELAAVRGVARMSVLLDCEPNPTSVETALRSHVGSADAWRQDAKTELGEFYGQTRRLAALLGVAGPAPNLQDAVDRVESLVRERAVQSAAPAEGVLSAAVGSEDGDLPGTVRGDGRETRVRTWDKDVFPWVAVQDPHGEPGTWLSLDAVRRLPVIGAIPGSPAAAARAEEARPMFQFLRDLDLALATRPELLATVSTVASADRQDGRRVNLYPHGIAGSRRWLRMLGLWLDSGLLADAGTVGAVGVGGDGEDAVHLHWPMSLAGDPYVVAVLDALDALALGLAVEGSTVTAEQLRTVLARADAAVTS